MKVGRSESQDSTEVPRRKRMAKGKRCQRV